MKTKFDEQCITFSQINMIFNARLFWRRLTTWTRVYIISRYMGIGTSEEAFSRLYIENLNFGDLLQIVFGRQIANQFSGLLNQYTIGIRELITAELQENTEAVVQAVDRLYQNATDRAAFLASINPYFDEAQLRDFLGTYLRYTIEEANSFASGDYRRDIELFDRLTELSNQIGYVFTEGLYDYITSGVQCPNAIPSEQCLTFEQMNAIFGLRMLWFDLITWSRAYMLAKTKDIGNEAEVMVRFGQVADELGDMMVRVFGEEAAFVSEGLVDTFVVLMDGLISAQMAGDIEEVNRNTQLLYQNADELAAFMASVNPFWDETRWRTILYDILRNLIVESTTFLTGEFGLNLDVFSVLLDQAESASNYFAQGLYQYVAAGGRLPDSQ